RCGFARGRPLQHIARFRGVVLECTGQVGVRWARRAYGFEPSSVSFTDRQGILPVLPVLVLEQNRDGRTDGDAVVHTRKDVGLVGLDLHTAAASVSLLS